MTCKCIHDIDAKLAPDHTLNATMGFNGAPPRALINLIRKDKWTPETRRGKPSVMLAAYCPWCGEKYEEGVPADVL